MLYLEYPADETKIRKRFIFTETRQPEIDRSVERIIGSVKKRGDKALLEFTKRFDGVNLSPTRLRVSPPELREAWRGLTPKLRGIVKLAAKRIEKFHAPQKQTGYETREPGGSVLAYRISPLSSVGLYVPGGTAAYPSSLLMNAVPAKLAGVREITMVTPPGSKGKVHPFILGTAYYLGLRKVYRVGGAQAVAALAFGTKIIPRVDKVVGPGNAYVAAAKRSLYGIIDIDMIAGPSEILVIADTTAKIPNIVADLLSQAEHDPLAVCVLIYIGRLDKKTFQRELRRQVERSPRREIIRNSLKSQGMVVTVKTRSQAVELANLKAPEHLEVLARNPDKLAPKLTNAGAIFVGPYTPEPIGDYVAGPNHVLPTGGTARFFSPLSVSSFTKATSILKLTPKDFSKLANPAIQFAEEEGLPAHANAVRLRLESKS